MKIINKLTWARFTRRSITFFWVSFFLQDRNFDSFHFHLHCYTCFIYSFETSFFLLFSSFHCNWMEMTKNEVYLFKVGYCWLLMRIELFELNKVDKWFEPEQTYHHDIISTYNLSIGLSNYHLQGRMRFFFFSYHLFRW